jgi:hypothetical protein
MADPLVCIPKRLPLDRLIHAAARAAEINPVNFPPLHRLAQLNANFRPTREEIAVVTTKYWQTKGVRLTVGFLDNPAADLKARILSHMNAWSTRLNVSFTESKIEPKVRISRVPNDGYWSYVGTDILSIEADQPTMNLDRFTMATSDEEFRRVVRHETGHTLGCPHEHMRRELVQKIDRDKAVEYFGATQGWSPLEVEQQVLTPLDERSLWGTGHTDPASIMCYQIPGTLTVDGKPILGGLDIDESDFAFMEKVYPKPVDAIASHGESGPASASEIAALNTKLEALTQDNEVLKKAIGVLAR